MGNWEGKERHFFRIKESFLPFDSSYLQNNRLGRLRTGAAIFPDNPPLSQRLLCKALYLAQRGKRNGILAGAFTRKRICR